MALAGQAKELDGSVGSSGQQISGPAAAPSKNTSRMVCNKARLGQESLHHTSIPPPVFLQGSVLLAPRLGSCCYCSPRVAYLQSPPHDSPYVLPRRSLCRSGPAITEGHQPHRKGRGRLFHGPLRAGILQQAVLQPLHPEMERSSHFSKSIGGKAISVGKRRHASTNPSDHLEFDPIPKDTQRYPK